MEARILGSVPLPKPSHHHLATLLLNTGHSHRKMAFLSIPLRLVEDSYELVSASVRAGAFTAEEAAAQSPDFYWLLWRALRADRRGG